MSKSSFLQSVNSLNLQGESLLCLGPVSLNSFQAISQCSQESKYPIMIIASRNQIESEEFGGGYVNNWSTESFMAEVNAMESNILIGRDHGGPFQSSRDQKLTDDPVEGMKLALKSLEIDIDSGMNFLHLDPSKYNKEPTLEGTASALCEMYGHCHEYAKSNDKDVYFEIGAEGHGPEVDDIDELNYFLDKSLRFIKSNKLKEPTFCVAKLGSYVRESANIGTFISDIQNKNTNKITEVVRTIHKHNLKLKQHNADYMPIEVTACIPELKIDAINLAPELGFIESSTILDTLSEYGLNEEKKHFMTLAKNSEHWKKWTDDVELDENKITRLAGHYLFSNDEFNILKAQVLNKIPDLDKIIQNKLQLFINNNLKALNIGK